MDLGTLIFQDCVIRQRSSFRFRQSWATVEIQKNLPKVGNSYLISYLLLLTQKTQILCYIIKKTDHFWDDTFYRKIISNVIASKNVNEIGNKI